TITGRTSIVTSGGDQYPISFLNSGLPLDKRYYFKLGSDNSFAIVDNSATVQHVKIDWDGVNSTTTFSGKIKVNSTLLLGQSPSDFTVINGGIFYRSDLNKGRIGIAGIWQNIATE